ncbi:MULTISPECIES: GntR family transcriptional regulator [Kocuria]|uniref:GntR family transcriptional regulator n=1 Tax=Kocuria TaxID=57493 RepID=UPI00142782B2|nr:MULTISPECIES: GntR family transcriptional regulator [Kocuria]MCG7432063.1 GntR family transcriptional regulator [Kocuria indica]QIR69097.1 GntR family transcriptional regulator [Kocuria sp. KD4]GHD84733.1 GntR family transcriptional regulator [Kocuria marina]
MSFPSTISIDRSSPVPLYHQLVHGIESAITEGELPPGTMLENELSLAKNLHLSRPTVRKAMDELVRSGLLVRKRGVGTQVVASEVRRPVRLTSLYDDLAQDASHPTTSVLYLEEVPSPAEIARALSIDVSAPVYRLRRLRHRNGKPLAIMENWVPPAIATLEREELERMGLYEILRRQGVNFRVATQKIGAAVASAEQAGLLGTSAGAALVTMSRTATDDIGRRVETGRHLYRGDSYSFELTLSA